MRAMSGVFRDTVRPQTMKARLACCLATSSGSLSSASGPLWSRKGKPVARKL